MATVQFPSAGILASYLEKNLQSVHISNENRPTIIEKTAALFAGAIQSTNEIDSEVLIMMRELKVTLQLTAMQQTAI